MMQFHIFMITKIEFYFAFSQIECYIELILLKMLKIFIIIRYINILDNYQLHFVY